MAYCAQSAENILIPCRLPAAYVIEVCDNFIGAHWAIMVWIVNWVNNDPYSAGIDIRRHNQTSVDTDVRSHTVRVNIFIMAVNQ